MTTISELIAHVESKNNRGAIRFEPATYNKFGNDTAKSNKVVQAILARIQIINVCSVRTAAMIYSTSWGKHQLMGFNIYAEPGFDLPMVEFLNSDVAQAKEFAAFLARNGLSNFTPEQLAGDQGKRLKFAMKYNGSIAYEIPLIDALKHFGFIVK